MGEKAFKEGWIPTDEVKKLSLHEVVAITFTREEPFWFGTNVRGHGARLRRLGWQPPWKSFDEYAREVISTEAAILKSEQDRKIEAERISAEFSVRLRVESDDEVNLTGRPRLARPVEAATHVGETRVAKTEEELEEEMEMNVLAGAAALTVLGNVDREMGGVQMEETSGGLTKIGNTRIGNTMIGDATIGQREIREGRNKMRNTKTQKTIIKQGIRGGRSKIQNTKKQKETTSLIKKRKAQDIRMEDEDIEDTDVEAQKSKRKKVVRWKGIDKEVEAEVEGESSQMGSGGGRMEDEEMGHRGILKIPAHGRIGRAPPGQGSGGRTKGKSLQSTQADSDETSDVEDLESEAKSLADWQRDTRGSIGRLRARYREVMRKRAAEAAEATEVEEADDEEEEEDDEEPGNELGSGGHTKGRTPQSEQADSNKHIDLQANVQVLNYDQYADFRSAYRQVEDKETMSDVIANATPSSSSSPVEQVILGLESLEDQALGDVVMQSIEPAQETSPESDESALDPTARDRKRLEMQERGYEAELKRELRYDQCKIVTMIDGEVVSDIESPEGSLESGEVRDGPGRLVLVNPGRGASMESGEIRDLPDGRKLVNPGRSTLAVLLGVEEVDEGTEGDVESEAEDDDEVEEEVEGKE